MKKGFMKVAFAAVIGLCMTSCKSYYYQVYDVSSDGLKQEDNSLVYENEDCKVLYNLWSNNGELKFAILNKTDKDIFVNLGQSFYVVNGKAIDYYQGRAYTSQSFTQASYAESYIVGAAKGSGFWGNGVYSENAQALVDAASGKLVKASSNSVTSKEMEIVCIPAKCYKVFNYYKVNPAWLKTCDKDKDFPTKSCQVGTYTKTSTPMSFKNRIAYGFTKSDVADKHIDNDFWISSVTNYSQNAATEKYMDKSDCYGIKTSARGRQFVIGGPNKFYKLYVDEGMGRGYGGY